MSGDRHDRLDAMAGGSGGADDEVPPAPRGLGDRSRPRLLLYAPPPAVGRAYVQLLEAEGYDVLLATDPAAAEALLASTAPRLVVAVVPVLAPALRRRWRELQPRATLRVFPGLGEMLDDLVVPSRSLLEFTVRSLAAVVGLLDGSRGVSPERVQRALALAEGAAAELKLDLRERATARLAAVLHEVPNLLGISAEADEGAAPTERFGRAAFERLLAEFFAALGAPLPLGGEPDAPEAGEGPVAAHHIAAAAVRLAQLCELADSQPELSLRRHHHLHPLAVEAVLAAWQRRRAEPRGRVLIVDSDVAASNLLALRLRNEGYEVAVVADGRSALDQVRRQPPGLVLAETVLPRLDGFGLLDALKREGSGRIPFVFLSARADALSVNKGLLLGAADYLPKGINPEVLLTKIQRLLVQEIGLADVAARISLADISATAADYPQVTYDELAAGTVILGRFHVEADLGEGGMGKVFRARDSRLEESVVLKVMRPSLSDDAAVLRRFKREIRLARRITHPSVVRIFDFWEAGPLKFVTMEALDGTDLRRELARRGAFPVPVALRVAAEVLEALEAAHAVGVLHRDVKPHNVLMLPTGKIKVLDFGIAQGLDGEAIDAAAGDGLVGTPEYVSPEQILGEPLDVRSDLYSTGVLLFELLTDRLPFRADSRAAVARLRLAQDAPPPSSLAAAVPPAVDELVGQLLRRDPRERFASAADALAALRSLRR
jgi:DNA-binding response OmpR family regulator